MRLEDYQEQELIDFPGLWSRGTGDQVPKDHFTDCLNVDYSEGEVFTRNGLSKAITLGYGLGNGKVRRFQTFFNPLGIITLILDDAGNLYTSSSRVGDTATTPLITIAGATDFVAIQMFSRIFIAFSDGVQGKSGINLKLYIPNSNIALDVIRDAGAAAPTAGSLISATQGAPSDIVNPGLYQIAVAFVTNTGYITQPGPLISSVYSPTIYNSADGVPATDVLTSDGTQPNDGDTITIGGNVYTFRTVLTNNGSVPNEIQIAVSGIVQTMAFLFDALSGTGQPGIYYGVGTTPNPAKLGIGSTALLNIVVLGNDLGIAGNSITVSTTSAHLSWSSPTLLGGTVGFKIDLSNIPTGPTGTVQRQILITKANELELFFLPSADGGVINDNTTTTAVLDFDDTVDLVASADYLFNELTSIPSPLGLLEYHGRLITFGENSNQSILRVSNAGNPETFLASDGVILISKDDGFFCSNAVDLRDIVYVHKNLGVFAVSDNGDIPANWPVYPVDKAVNTPIHGISELFGLAGIKATRDMYFAVDRSGIIIFNGSFVKPPLTYKVNKIWQTLNFNYYYKVVLVLDEQNHKIYCSFPTGSNTENDTLIMGDYSKCGPFNPYSIQTEIMKIKWGVYQFKPGNALKQPTAIGLISVPNDSVPTLKMGSINGGGYVWKLDPTTTTDDGTAIISYVEGPLLFWQSGYIHFFTAVRMRIIGSGNLEITIKGEDDVLPTNLYTVAGGNPIVLQTAPGQEVLARFNFQNEKAKLKFNVSSGNFILSKITFFGQPMYQMRPM